MKPRATREVEILRFMGDLEREPEHPLHVRLLACQLARGLKQMLQFGELETFVLESAALLHDVGWTVAPTGKKHHKASARLILGYPWKTVPRRVVKLIAATARYHRKSVPKASHPEYGPLSKKDRKLVDRCAAALRIADGLDRTHGQKVGKVTVEASKGRWLIRCFSKVKIEPELKMAKEKADLAEKTFGVSVEFVSMKC